MLVDCIKYFILFVFMLSILGIVNVIFYIRIKMMLVFFSEYVLFVRVCGEMEW